MTQKEKIPEWKIEGAKRELNKKRRLLKDKQTRRRRLEEDLKITIHTINRLQRDIASFEIPSNK